MANGIVLVDKKANISTTREEAYLKKVFDTNKVGHAGTLDPFATGLIICGINKGTKALPFIECQEKTYIAALQLGARTDTGDRTGQYEESRPFAPHDFKEIQQVMDSFIGPYLQTPPMYSALKRNGVPLYKLARQNKKVARTPREVFVKDIRLLSFLPDLGLAEFETVVSKGTYIRTLGEDIATRINELGYLSALRRTRIGRFGIEDAHAIDLIIPERDLIPLQDVFNDILKITVGSEDEARVRCGAAIRLKETGGRPIVMLLSVGGESLALYKQDKDDEYRPLKEFI